MRLPKGITAAGDERSEPPNGRAQLHSVAIASLSPAGAAPDAGESAAQAGSEALLRRAPMAYVWNQIGSLWLFFSSFLLTLVVARGLGQTHYGIFAEALTVFNTAVYLAAFGLEDAATVFVPRALAAVGPLATATLIRRLLVSRIIGVLVIGAGIAVLIPGLAHLLATTYTPAAVYFVGLSHLPGLDSLALAVAAYVAGAGMMNLLGAIFTALLRTRLTLVVGGLAQLANVGGVLMITRYGGGVGGVLWVLAAATWAASIVYFLLLAPYLRVLQQPSQQLADSQVDATPTAQARADGRFAPVLRLGGAAWLTNLITSALLKQSAVSLLQYFVVSAVAIGYFTLAFQLAHAAAYLLVAGLGGVGLAALAAAYVGQQRGHLTVAWRTICKTQMLLAVPLLAFCAPHADAIALFLYGRRYTAVGGLLTIFILFTLLQRLAGGGTHQAALYVLGRQGLAFVFQFGGLVLTLALGYLLIPLLTTRLGTLGGPAGALIAVGAGQVGVEIAQLIAVSRSLRRSYPNGFGARLCLALVPPTLLSGMWRPMVPHMIVSWLMTAPSWLSWLSTSSLLSPLYELVGAGTWFVLLLPVCLAITRPLDREDIELLAQVNPRLARLLSPIASHAASADRQLRRPA
ncbi:MAG: oligosaccharide flippase family protein [Ktedonobacterales bacterium]